MDYNTYIIIIHGRMPRLTRTERGSGSTNEFSRFPDTRVNLRLPSSPPNHVLSGQSVRQPSLSRSRHLRTNSSSWDRTGISEDIEESERRGPIPEILEVMFRDDWRRGFHRAVEFVFPLENRERELGPRTPLHHDICRHAARLLEQGPCVVLCRRLQGMLLASPRSA